MNTGLVRYIILILLSPVDITKQKGGGGGGDVISEVSRQNYTVLRYTQMVQGSKFIINDK